MEWDYPVNCPQLSLHTAPPRFGSSGRRIAAGFLMAPKRLGAKAQAKYVVRSETVSGARATRAEDPRRNQNRNVLCAVDMKNEWYDRHRRISPGYRKVNLSFVVLFAARWQVSQKALSRKTRPPHPESFCLAGAFWCIKGQVMLPSRYAKRVSFV